MLPASKDPNNIFEILVPEMKSIPSIMGSAWTAVLLGVVGHFLPVSVSSLEDRAELCTISLSLGDWFRGLVFMALLSPPLARLSAAGTRPDRPGGLYTHCTSRFAHRWQPVSPGTHFSLVWWHLSHELRSPRVWEPVGAIPRGESGFNVIWFLVEEEPSGGSADRVGQQCQCRKCQAEPRSKFGYLWGLCNLYFTGCLRLVSKRRDRHNLA
jgi:hypothetical protein